MGALVVLGVLGTLAVAWCFVREHKDEARLRAEEDRADRNRARHDVWNSVKGQTYPHELADGTFHWYPTDHGRAVRLRRAAPRS